MKVELISYTPNALDLLLFTKQTRLKMGLGTYQEIVTWSEEKKAEELEYMRNTIASSWEFVDYVFAITDVTRAFTHQLVRHRIGTSFAQQSQRTVDMSGFEYMTPKGLTACGTAVYKDAMRDINESYQHLVKGGVPAQDARGLLPTNIHTNIIFKANLRTLHDMGLKRLCVKTQGEFQRVFKEVRNCVLNVHPWAEKFILPWCAFHGTCCFPTFPTESCYVKPSVYNPDTGMAYGATDSHERGNLADSREDIQKRWERGQ